MDHVREHRSVLATVEKQLQIAIARDRPRGVAHEELVRSIELVRDRVRGAAGHDQREQRANGAEDPALPAGSSTPHVLRTCLCRVSIVRTPRRRSARFAGTATNS